MNKFGSKDFFLQYIANQIEKEGKTQEVIHRVHFSMTQFIFESFGNKDALGMVKNLTDACETLSNIKRGVSYLD